MLRMAIQAKGRLNEDTMGLLADAGIDVAPAKRKLVAKASGFSAMTTSHRLSTSAWQTWASWD